MAKISASDVKKLRDLTGARVLDCKNALEEAKGDFKKAETIVAKKGLARAEKNQDRETAAGMIAQYVHTNGKVAALIELRCDTDFVAQNVEFKQLGKDIAMQIVAMNPEDVEELLSQEFIKDASTTIEQLVKALSGKIGEKMVISRFTRFELGQE
jgi:elongation factor Ts